MLIALSELESGAGAAAVASSAGWELKPVGACREDACVPLPAGADAREVARRLGLPIVEDSETNMAAVGPEGRGSVLRSAGLPDIELLDRHGAPVRLRSLLGKRLVVTSWATWCGCRLDLPVWQELRTELLPYGVEIVTVALDAGGPAAIAPFHDRAGTEHPALVDTRHQLVRELGFVNVPMAIWVDVDGMIVRPAEAAWPGRVVFQEDGPMQDMVSGARGDDYVRRMVEESGRIKADPAGYVAGLRDWALRGAESDWALRPDEVVAHSAGRDPDTALGAAHAELALWLRDQERTEASRAHFREAHRLDPENWSVKRQSWYLEDPLQRPTGVYDTDFVSDIVRDGAENYYRPSAGRRGEHG